MRNVIILFAVVLSMTVVSQLCAQSGSRSSSSRSRVRQPSRAQLERLAKQQQLAAQQFEKQQEEYGRQQFRQTLVQLALRENRSANSRRLREAFREAEQDYKALRGRNLTPEQVGVLQVPFRLTGKDIDRSSGAVQWPEALRADQFTELTKSVDTTIAAGVNSDKTAKQFFSELEALNTAANQAAASKEIKSSDYAKARWFITGLANEVRATEHGDVLLTQ